MVPQMGARAPAAKERTAGEESEVDVPQTNGKGTGAQTGRHGILSDAPIGPKQMLHLARGAGEEVSGGPPIPKQSGCVCEIHPRLDSQRPGRDGCSGCARNCEEEAAWAISDEVKIVLARAFRQLPEVQSFLCPVWSERIGQEEHTMLGVYGHRQVFAREKVPTFARQVFDEIEGSQQLRVAQPVWAEA